MDRLTEILTDMVRSALSWEQENGKALTCIPPAYTMRPPENTQEMENNENTDLKPKEHYPDNVRGPEGTQG